MAKRILIVDDDPDLRSSLASILGETFEVLEAADGDQALELFTEQRPRLILLDISMPGPGGLEVLAATRALDPSAKVVMLTSHSELDLARKALGLGAIEYVTKPFDAEYIRAEVSRLLNEPLEPPNEKPWRIAP